jgi:tetratricopeptide (TPR) repeat protein
MSIERGTLLLQTGRFNEAEQQFRAALIEEPSNALAHAMVGLCLLNQKSYAAAENAARQSIGLRPDWYVGYSVLASVLSERERVKPAVEAIHKAIELNPFDPHLHGTLASLRLKQRDWPATLAAADAGLEIDPENRECLNLRSIALVKLGRRNEAGATLAGALQRNPHDAMTHANQGWTLLNSGDHKAALVHFREALRIDPNLEWAKAGIVESMKARNIIYRVMLRYFLFMARMSGGMQWGIIIGLYVGQQVLFQLGESHPAFAPFVLPIILAYMVFALLTWLASPMFNLMLRIDRFGRYALSRDQTAASNWVGGLLAVGLVLFVIGCFRGENMVTRQGPFQIAGLLTAVLSLTMSAVYRCPVGWPRIVMAVYTLCLAMVMAFFAGSAFVKSWHGVEVVDMLRDRAKLMIEIGILAAGVVANALQAAVVTR